jgi:peroxiredoxin
MISKATYFFFTLGLLSLWLDNHLYGQHSTIKPTVQKQSKATVYLFLSEYCPICVYYTPTIRQIHQQFEQQSIQFIGVFPNKHSTDSAITAYQKKYAIPFELVQGAAAKHLTLQWQATITPEIVVLDSSQQVVYRGRIDNAYVKVGRKRAKVDQQDLQSALDNYVKGKKIRPDRTIPIGCYLTLPKSP